MIDGAVRSAEVVVPVVLDLISVKSVVDFGCGQGAWLKAFVDAGVETALGLDGEYVDRGNLLVAAEQFQAADLRRPIRLAERFDLAISLEVGEHLPGHAAATLVDSLATAAPVVLFSAAVPGQGGTSHVNEQWPAYWERLFARHQMRKYDVIRPLIWQNRSIELWYRQNIYVYANENRGDLAALPQFEPELSLVSTDVLAEATAPSRSRVIRYSAMLRGLRSRFRHGKHLRRPN
jgi:SAM-dependent methyltransferase